MICWWGRRIISGRLRTVRLSLTVSSRSTRWSFGLRSPSYIVIIVSIRRSFRTQGRCREVFSCLVFCRGEKCRVVFVIFDLISRSDERRSLFFLPFVQRWNDNSFFESTFIIGTIIRIIVGSGGSLILLLKRRSKHCRFGECVGRVFDRLQ